MRDPQSRGSPWGGQGVNPRVLGMVLTALRGEASGKEGERGCSKLKTLLLNSLPFPFLPAWSHPAASPGPAPAQQGQGRLAGTLGTRGGGLCAPHKAALEHSAPRSPPRLHPCPTGRGLLRVWAQPPQAGAARPPLGTIGGCPSAVGSTWGGVPQSLPGLPGAAALHLRLPKMDFLLGFFSPTLSPMSSRAFSSSSCCWMGPSDLFSSFPRASAPAAGFRRSFSLITCPKRENGIRMIPSRIRGKGGGCDSAVPTDLRHQGFAAVPLHRHGEVQPGPGVVVVLQARQHQV